MKIKIRGKQLVSLGLVATLCLGTVSYGAYAAGVKKASAENRGKVSAESILDAVNPTAKEETVYVIADANGKAKKVIVSDWLKNPDKAKSLKDNSSLKDIENVEGNETYSIDKDKMKVWDAQGNDIFYQGESDKELPVDVKISYKLDGKTISPKDLVGKKGRVTIRFDYVNNQYENVSIDGASEKIYVPFVMMTGTVLENKNFSNITVTNGKVINDGGKTFVMGFAFPGLSDNLGISNSKINIPDYVEIEADAKDFNLATTMTLATNDVFNDINTSDLKTPEDLQSKLGEFVSSAQKLADGSSTLYEGLDTLLQKSGQLIAGIDQLHEGTEILSKGAGMFSGGTKELQAGLVQLNQGLKQLTENSDALNQGGKQVFDSLLNMAQSQINIQLKGAGLSVGALTIDNYHSEISKVISALDPSKIEAIAEGKAHQQVDAKVRENAGEIRGAVENSMRNQVFSAVLSGAGMDMTPDQYTQALEAGKIPEAVSSQIEAALNGKMESAEIQGKIESVTENKIQDIIADNMKSPAVTKGIQSAVEQGKKGVGSLEALLSQLDNYNKFYQGLLAYTNGVNKAYDGSNKILQGATTLNEKSKELADGAEKVNKGVTSLKDNSGKLVDGVSQLRDGSLQLSEGMKKFNEEGVKKIANIFDSNLGSLGARIKATVDVSRNYTNYSGKAEGTKSTVKFVYKTEEIAKKEDKK